MVTRTVSVLKLLLLCQGWAWKEEGWQIDLTGLEKEGCDEEGWTYATDFSWLTFPPLPGAGRFKRVRISTASDLYSHSYCPSA